MNSTSVFPDKLLLAHTSRGPSEVSKAVAPATCDGTFAHNPSNPDRIDAQGASSDSGVGRLIGLILVVLGPALFWTAGLALTGRLLGFTVTPGMLAGTFLPIFSFLLLACSTCFLHLRETGASELERGDPDGEILPTGFASLVPSSESKETLSAVS